MTDPEPKTLTELSGCNCGMCRAKTQGLMGIETLATMDKVCGDNLSHGLDPKNPTEAPEIRENAE